MVPRKAPGSMDRTIPSLKAAALRLQNLLHAADLPVKKTRIAQIIDIAGAKSGLSDATSMYHASVSLERFAASRKRLMQTLNYSPQSFEFCTVILHFAF